MTPLVDQPALTLRDHLRAGELTALALTRACLERIEQREPEIQAWQFLDAEHALAQARALDEARDRNEALGPLFGLPVAVKDIFDTADMPTENGTHLHAGRRPERDAWAVARLRQLGAVILGKTVTTEMATFTPGKTRNPHAATRTPGGSSSGSAAAVACGMAPLALGSQTNGSVIRPASFCGIHGFKPSFGLIPRTGCLMQSHSLDHVGVFARTTADCAFLAEMLTGFDSGDDATTPTAAPGLLATITSRMERAPRLAFAGGPTWVDADASTRQRFNALIAKLGDVVQAADLPAFFNDAIEQHRRVWHGELAHYLKAEYDAGEQGLSPRLRGMIESGQELRTVAYLGALAWRKRGRALLREHLAGFDALLTPAAPGEAPEGLETTGSPVFCSLWTLLGVPAISLPLLEGPSGMPLGCQLVAAPGDDARLLRTASWLERRLAGATLDD